ncbi:MAG: hypothetical protein KDB11_01100 [Planctomycetales bacterium]|nr:hypothetical protein [Planctomycetales bacterium]
MFTLRGRSGQDVVMPANALIVGLLALQCMFVTARRSGMSVTTGEYGAPRCVRPEELFQV